MDFKHLRGTHTRVLFLLPRNPQSGRWSFSAGENWWDPSVQWLHLVVGERTSVRWAQQKWISRRKVQEGIWVGRLITLMKWSETRRALPAKV